MNEEQVKKLITEDQQLMDILGIINNLKLNDCWLCAGTIRNFIWNSLTNKQGSSVTTDIDVVFYDKDISYEETILIQEMLKMSHPNFDWEVKNQIYMHEHNPKMKPYESSRDAISKFPEKCTAIAARLAKEEIELFIPYGLSDNINFIVQPTPFFLENIERKTVYNKRVTSKNWQKQWPTLKIVLCNDV